MKEKSGMAIPMVLGILVIIMTSFATVQMFLRQSNLNLNLIVDENVLLNAAEAILSKEVAKLKKKSWAERWFKKDGKGAQTGNEKGIFVNDAGYEGLEYYFYIEDVKYCDYFADKPITAGIKKDDIVPKIARIYIQVVYKNLKKAIECELLFRSIEKENWKEIPNAKNLTLTGTPGDPLVQKGREVFADARKRMEDKHGINDAIEHVLQDGLNSGSFDDPAGLDAVTSANLDPLSQKVPEKNIADNLDAATRIVDDFAVKKENSPLTNPTQDYDQRIDKILDALKIANGQPPAYRKQSFPECLYPLGLAYIDKATVSRGPAIVPYKSGIGNDPKDWAAIPVFYDMGPQLWLGPTPPVTIPVGAGDIDSDSCYSERSYFFKLAESCFYTIVAKFPESKFAVDAHFRLSETKVCLASRYGNAYSQNEARKVLIELNDKIAKKIFPPNFKVNDGDKMLKDFNGKEYESIRKNQIAFSGAMNGPNPDVYTVDADGSNLKRLTNDMAAYWPRFSPDGKKILFNSPNGPSSWDIFIMNADGSNLFNLTNSPDSEYLSANFSPKGEKIIYFSPNSGSGNQICSINVDGSGFQNVSNNADSNRYPCFSPDGSKIAFCTTKWGSWELAIMNSDGSNQTRLTTGGLTNYDPCFSIDGKKIAFVSETTDICLINIDGTNFVNLTNSPGWNERYPNFTPDGSRIIYETGETGDQVFSMKTDGSDKKKIADYNPARAPCSSRILDDPFPKAF